MGLPIQRSQRAELVDYATAITGDRARGEDMVQEAFLRFETTPNRQAVAEPFGYLRRIVRNLAFDWLRRRTVERRIFIGVEEPEEVTEDVPTAEAALNARQELRIVMAALNELPERTRRALEMHRFEGAKLVEIAATLGISVTLAHKLIHEALDHCRRRLAEKD